MNLAAERACIICLLLAVSSATTGGGSASAQDRAQADLPDDYLPFTFRQLEDRLEGVCPYLEGFTISIDIPALLMADGVSIETIFSLVRDREIGGTLTYPNAAKTPIQYEIVRHREREDIYMKTTLGYFLWEYAAVRNDTLSMAIYWWYAPPATEVDLAILDMAKRLVSDPRNWHQDDDRQCEDDIATNRWSLFCALKHSSIEMTGEYNHHNTAMQTARFVIDSLIPDHGFAHTLMDYNNAGSTSHGEIIDVLDEARRRIADVIEWPARGSRPTPLVAPGACLPLGPSALGAASIWLNQSTLSLATG
jgi:hypothetical protein